jgi:hypothetical protein
MNERCALCGAILPGFPATQIQMEPQAIETVHWCDACIASRLPPEEAVSFMKALAILEGRLVTEQN